MMSVIIDTKELAQQQATDKTATRIGITLIQSQTTKVSTSRNKQQLLL